DARLGVEDRDLVGFGRGFEQFFERAAGRHAVADDDETPTRRSLDVGVEGFLLDVAHRAALQALTAVSAERSSQVRRQRAPTPVSAVNAASARQAKIARPAP